MIFFFLSCYVYMCLFVFLPQFYTHLSVSVAAELSVYV